MVTAIFWQFGIIFKVFDFYLYSFCDNLLLFTINYIQGWVEALQLMKTGSKWRLFVPSDLAYGDRGAGDKIGPGTVLVFDVELLSIQ